MKLFPFSLIILLSCTNNTVVVDKKKDITAGDVVKSAADIKPDSSNVKIAYAKSLIDTSHSLIKRSLTEKETSRQNDQLIASLMKSYFSVFQKLTPIGKAEVTKYRIQKIKELADFKIKNGL